MKTMLKTFCTDLMFQKKITVPHQNQPPKKVKRLKKMTKSTNNTTRLSPKSKLILFGGGYVTGTLSLAFSHLCSTVLKSDSPEKDKHVAEEDDDPMDEDQDEDDEENDDDVDIILEPEDDEHTMDSQQPSSQKPQEISNESTQSTNPLVTIKPGQQIKEASQSSNTTTKASASSASLDAAKNSSGGIDLDADDEYNGQPITEVAVDTFEDKPWRKPGADITDYFNFGFNEMSWRAYCAKQKMMRDKKVAGKADINIPDFMKMGMMMPLMDGGGGGGGVMHMGMMNSMMNLTPPPSQLGDSQLFSAARTSSQPTMPSIGSAPNRSNGMNPSGRTNPVHGVNSHGSRR
ncbi:Fip1 motif-domain-containing protein [Absidia repens]|uniref:Fip1 motif-domain-containing protein n=1 Tax=Absidia repens TaxID=90262 RepID=A0A1X2J2M7_9FUNG|nr:Fip1 motif-domain-containing protein [Absidia repens]